MYPIDLQTILRVLSHQSGELRATVKQVAGIKEECQASVILSSGKVVSCVIYHTGKPVLSGEEAFRTLARKGTLEWNYVPAASQPSDPSLPTQTPSGPLPAQMSPRTQILPESASTFYQRQYNEDTILPSMIPIQIQKVGMEALATWPRPYRFVYQLSTGDKTITEIAQLLSLTPEQMGTILLFLRKRSLITLR